MRLATPNISDSEAFHSSSERLMVVQEVADLLQVSETWVIRSDLPFVKLGRLRRYHVRDVEEFVRARHSQALRQSGSRMAPKRKVLALPRPAAEHPARRGPHHAGARS